MVIHNTGGPEMMGCDFSSAGDDKEQIIGYVSHLINDNGVTLRIRPINLNDSDAWIVFVNGLSPNSKFYRFHHIIKDVCAEDALPFCSIDFINSFALIAELVKDAYPFKL